MTLFSQGNTNDIDHLMKTDTYVGMIRQCKGLGDEKLRILWGRLSGQYG
jgi:hypothetical protein